MRLEQRSSLMPVFMLCHLLQHASRLAVALAAISLGCAPARAVEFSVPAPPTQQWGNETLARIDADFWLPGRNLYADQGHLNKPAVPPPTMAWGAGVQLSALAAAAARDPDRYRSRLAAFVTGLNSYWTNANNIGGYDVQPGPKPNDRYYDDNAWIVLALAETYEVTHDPRDLARAEDTQRFVLSGEDQQLGGGIYWHEPKKETKNTCVNAPAIVGALRLFQLTHKPEDLTAARRLYTWTCAHLQDPGGLFADNIHLDGHVDHATYSYNTGLMLRAASLFYGLTHEPAYLADAHRIAHAAEARWVDPATGGIKDTGKFAHLLLEGFLALYDQDHDAHWLNIDRNALNFVHSQARDPNGYYGGNWNQKVTAPLPQFPLLDEASAARAFWVADRYRDR